MSSVVGMTLARVRALGPEEAGALRALGAFTVALVGAPAATYAVAVRKVCPAAYEMYGTSFLATESGRATCAGMFAIVAVNVVLLAYVLWVAREKSPLRASREKDE